MFAKHLVVKTLSLSPSSQEYSRDVTDETCRNFCHVYDFCRFIKVFTIIIITATQHNFLPVFVIYASFAKISCYFCYDDDYDGVVEMNKCMEGEEQKWTMVVRSCSKPGK